ncbi:Glycosyl transferases group 1 [Posidoniimonas corsicana]|uniref:Glycosyl transferases group 1 n=1 Tax=Posidoniimonas corsicana TaxID=1938618 RepID=A0A5C5VEK2_9BACT|nr:glycosyltransferase [Posidoniimonas corsicana]TWT37058.1 Glycosyl transferases group 1 [Posidoniimonas corsicana]
MPTRVLHLLPTLQGADAARRVALLCEQLPRDQFEQHVAAFRAAGAAAPRLRSLAAGVHDLRRRFRRDPIAALALRRLARSLNVDVVHAWGAEAATHAAWCGRRVVRTTSDDEPLAGWLTSNTLPFTPPVAWTAATQPLQPTGEAMARPPELPAHARLIGAAAPLVPASRLKELIWAIDLIRVVQPDVWLVIVGDGPQRASLEEFSRLACEENRTLLLGDRGDLPDLLPHFDLWWQSGQPADPPLTLLEALAAELPVVADRCDSAAAVVEEGVTGALIKPADRAERAKSTLKLLEADSRRHADDSCPVGALPSSDELIAACAAAYAAER